VLTVRVAAAPPADKSVRRIRHLDDCGWRRVPGNAAAARAISIATRSYGAKSTKRSALWKE